MNGSINGTTPSRSLRLALPAALPNSTKLSAASSSPSTVLSSSHNSLVLADVPASVLCPRLPNARKILRIAPTISRQTFVPYRAIPSPAFYGSPHRRFTSSPALFLRSCQFALASVTSSIVLNVIRVYPLYRPARFVLNAGVTHAALSSIVPAESRFAFSHRPFRPIPSGIKNSGDISAAADSFFFLGQLNCPLLSHLLPLQGKGLIAAENEDLAVANNLATLCISAHCRYILYTFSL